MTNKMCFRCDSFFWTDSSSSTLCRTCFSQVMEKRTCSNCRCEFWTEKIQPAKWPCEACLEEVLHYYIITTKTNPSTSALTVDFLRDLIFLAHPDKHANSEKATKATQRLLELRGQWGQYE